MNADGRISLAHLKDLGLPVPPSARIEFVADDDQLRRAVTAAIGTMGGPTGRSLGSATNPLFVAITAETASLPVAFLGTTRESLSWLSDRAERALVESIRRRYLPGATESDPIGQILEAARSLKASSVTLLPMVLGCYAEGDGSGTARSRDLETGEARLNGMFVPGACGFAAEADPRSRPLTEYSAEPWWRRLAAAVETLEAHHRYAVEMEFTVQDGQIYVLGAQPVPRDAVAACTVAAALLSEGRLDASGALGRVTPEEFATVLRPRDSGPEPRVVIGHGLGVSPGVVCGVATFDPGRAVDRGDRGETVVLIRTETRPEDLTALLAAAAIVTTRGGRTSHAAVVARAVGRACVVGLADAVIDQARDVLEVGGVTVADGDVITIDGSRGLVALGGCPQAQPAGEPPPLGPAPLSLLAAADTQRRMQVWVNADTAADAAAARRAGAAGIGLCRTEHMFLGDRQRLLADVLLGPNHSTAQESLGDLHRLQRKEFCEILSAMDGLPVTVRLLDPPRHEFLPDLTDVSIQVAVAAATGHRDPAAERRLRAVQRLSERNPMLGVRGIRLGVLLPWLYEMQIVALLEATVARIREGGAPRPQLLVPMVATAAEMRPVLAFTAHALAEARALADRDFTLPIGAMIETPRAALTAAELAGVADFFSFGTNDLTQLTWGLSRDDTDATVLRPYQNLGLIDFSPIEHLDRAGVGQLITTAVETGRRVRPGMRMGVCGEHAGDPDSIQAFHDSGLDYVSCSRQDLALARYAAGYAARTRKKAGFAQ
ncbi:MAG TPA: putative PEP-binding protein [Candidatus Limnocylindrales bacterium]